MYTHKIIDTRIHPPHPSHSNIHTLYTYTHPHPCKHKHISTYTHTYIQIDPTHVCTHRQTHT